MKYKNIFIATISIVYSSCVFSNTLNPNVSSDLITPEYEELENKKSYLTSTIFNQIVDDNLMRIVKKADQEIYGIEINKNIIEDLEKYLRNNSLTNSADIIKNNIINKNGHIEIQSDSTELKMGIENYLSERKLLTEQNRNEAIQQIKLNKTIIYGMPESILTLDNLSSPEELNKIVDNLNTKNRHLLLLEKNVEQDLAEISESQKSKYTFVSALAINNKHDIEENIIVIDSNSKKTRENREDIDKNIHATNSNDNNIKENRNDINDIKENYIDNLNINGKNISLKSHFATLYTEQSASISEFKALKNNFEHFKSDTQNRFYKVEKRANQGIASVAAMSNLPFTDNATFSTAIGIGNYRNATALAWGMQYRINENIKVRASTAWNETNSWVSAGGVGISW